MDLAGTGQVGFHPREKNPARLFRKKVCISFLYESIELRDETSCWGYIISSTQARRPAWRSSNILQPVFGAGIALPPAP